MENTNCNNTNCETADMYKALYNDLWDSILQFTRNAALMALDANNNADKFEEPAELVRFGNKVVATMCRQLVDILEEAVEDEKALRNEIKGGA